MVIYGTKTNFIEFREIDGGTAVLAHGSMDNRSKQHDTWPGQLSCLKAVITLLNLSLYCDGYLCLFIQSALNEVVLTTHSYFKSTSEGMPLDILWECPVLPLWR